jgi:signal transduction histidine kinase
MSAINTATSDQRDSLGQTAVSAILVGVAFYFGCELGLALMTPSNSIAMFFPANAIMLAALLLTNQRRWWAYLLVMALVDIAISIGDELSVHRVVLYAAANLLEVLVAAIGLKFFVTGPLKFERLQEMLTFLLLAALVAPIASASVASAATLFEAPDTNYWRLWRAWFLSDALGLLIVTPLIVLWFRAGFSWLTSVTLNRAMEAMGLTLSLFVVCYFALGGTVGAAGNFPALLYAPVPLLLWAALRFNQHGAHLAILVITAFSVSNAVNGLGPFTTNTPTDNVLSLQLYLIAAAIPMMLLSVVLSERKQADDEKMELVRQLHQLQKIEAVGTLAGGIAHDFNNILTTILGYTEMLLIDKVDRSDSKKYLEQVDRAGRRAQRLVKQLLTFGQLDELSLRPIAMPPVVEHAIETVRATLPSDVEVTTMISPHCAPVLADSTQILQVVQNLCLNASHAMTDAPKLIAVRLTQVELAPSNELPAGSYLKLTISDTGQGMSAETQLRIFEPYYSTRGVAGDGTGLGLPIVHGIVERHHGIVTIRSEVGKGTTVDVLLPVTAEASVADVY